ncbi:hypothetical protein [Brunnivagina elsteri]|uniref:Uncharacterized protein n=1 Tax=Brunnivagina elsteri CCALA 953 TaxID=987040 RepID=A0A2A2TNG8_9CYAN|nr:hypothetical protein [Calothrix elsteri]PAX59982.1 hypothetical protein CK510_04185 [Calothrix elsteri CCALA 953]
MNINSGIRLQVIGQTVTLAIEDGREWGQRFLDDSSWRGDKKKMAKHAARESTFASRRKSINRRLSATGGMSSEVAMSLYSQVKLASTLFTIYEIDTIRVSSQSLVLAAVAGVSITELANQLEINPTQQNIQKALASVPNKKIAELNKNLGIKLMSQVSDTKINICGHSVKTFIQAYRNPMLLG